MISLMDLHLKAVSRFAIENANGHASYPVNAIAILNSSSSRLIARLTPFSPLYCNV